MSKICALCPKTVSKRHTLCYNCFKQYKAYRNEEWFKFLAKAQIKQDEIDMIESLSVDSMYTLPDYEGGLVKKRVGRPSKDWITVNKVLAIYDESVDRERNGLGKRKSLRAIQNEVGSVNFLTIRSILRKYRSDVI